MDTKYLFISFVIGPRIMIFRNISRNIGETRNYVEYFVQYLVFLYILCYISEILIIFWTVKAIDILYSYSSCSVGEPSPEAS